MRVTTLEHLSHIVYRLRNESDPAAVADSLESLVNMRLKEGDLGIKFNDGIKKRMRKVMREGL